MRSIADEEDHWAGIPVPLDGERLVVEPSFPNAEGLMKLGGEQEIADDEPDVPLKLRNAFYSSWKHCDVLVIEKSNGRVTYGLQPAAHHLMQDLRTMACSAAWGIEQESNALDLLGTLVAHYKFKEYLLTGMFLERSKRSGVLYLFRRLKPTVAIQMDFATNTTKVMCALCMHPIGYYAGSWAGAMCPTDDVVAHLMLMRGDEAMFWRRAQQHPPWRPEAGL